MQGFGDTAEKLEAEKAELENYRLKLLEQEAQRRSREAKAQATVYEKPTSNEAAKRRWKWAMEQIKFKNMMGRMDLKGVKRNMQRSIGHRLEQVEKSLDTFQFNLDNLRVGSDSATSDVKDTVRFLEHKLQTLTQKIASCEQSHVDLVEWRQQHEETLLKLSNTLHHTDGQVALIQKREDEARSNSENKARALESIYASVTAKLGEIALDAQATATRPPICDSSLEPVLHAFQSRLLEPRGVIAQLEEAAEKPLQERSQEVHEAAWVLHKLLKFESDASSRQQANPALTGRWISIQQVQNRNGDQTFADDVATAYTQLLELMRHHTNPGHVDLRALWLEDYVKNLADANELNEKLALLSANAEATSRMASAAMSREDIEETCARLIRTALNEEAERSNALRDISSTVEFRELCDRLADAHSEAVELRAQLNDKAAAADVTSSLERINSQLVRMRASTWDRSQLEDFLALKADKTDIERIALALAANANDDAEPILAVKEQIPKYKCLSCDRPLYHGVRNGSRRVGSPAAFERLSEAHAGGRGGDELALIQAGRVQAMAKSIATTDQNSFCSGLRHISGISQPQSALSAAKAEFHSRSNSDSAASPTRVPYTYMRSQHPALLYQGGIRAAQNGLLPSVRASGSRHLQRN